jgi:ribosomal protein S1
MQAPVAQAEPAPEADALAEAPAEAAASQDGAAEEEATAQKPALGKRWVEAIRLQEEGAVCEGKIRSLHKAGVVVELKTHKLRGFLPWMRMDRTRLPDPATAAQEDLNSLLSKTVSVKVLQARAARSLSSSRPALHGMRRRAACIVGHLSRMRAAYAQ